MLGERKTKLKHAYASVCAQRKVASSKEMTSTVRMVVFMKISSHCLELCRDFGASEAARDYDS